MMTASAQTTKQINAIYKSTFEKAGMEGACLYEVTFTSEAGSQMVFTDIFHGQYNEGLMKMFCDERKLSDEEVNKFNENGKVERTMKTSVGKKFNIKYTEGDCMSIETAQISMPTEDTMLVRIKKEQTTFQAKNPCPNCPIEIAKVFLKNYLAKADKEILSETNERKRSSMIEAKNYIKESVTLNKYVPYYFSGTRATVIINHKMQGRGKNLAIQLKKTSNKWTAIGIDDSWTYCDGIAQEDMISDLQQIIGCDIYFKTQK